MPITLTVDSCAGELIPELAGKIRLLAPHVDRIEVNVTGVGMVLSEHLEDLAVEHHAYRPFMEGQHV